ATPSPAVPPPQQQPQPQQTSPQPTPPIAPAASAPNAPVNLFEAAAQAARGGGATAAPRQSAAPAAGAGAALGGDLGVLRDSPQFQQLRQLVQSNPQLLEPIIQNIAQGNPQLAALINQNPEAFLQLLAEGGGDGGEGGALPPRAIQVTPEEAEAIGRV